MYCNYRSSKLIKALNSNIVWSISNFNGVSLNNISVYMPCTPTETESYATCTG